MNISKSIIFKFWSSVNWTGKCHGGSWKDYEFFNHYSNQKTPDNSLCFRKEIEKFSLRSREFSGKTVESTVTKKKNRSWNYLIYYRLESLYTLAVRSHDFLASTLTIQQFQNFSGLKLNVNGEFKFDIYRVEKGNKKSVSKTYHSAKSMHTALFLLYVVNQQQKNCCLLSNEWFPKNCDAIYTMICNKSRISLEVRKQVPLENRSVDNTSQNGPFCG